MFGAAPKPPKLADAVVIVIDAQREYLDGKVPLVNMESALTEIETLLGKARALKIPIFHLQHQAPTGAPVFAPESEFNQIIKQVQPEDDEPVIVKHHPSGFIDTNLAQLIKDSGRKDVVLVGFMTHMCVNATARGAQDLGLSPTVISRACATRDLPGADGAIVSAKSIHEANLASLADLIACVVTDAHSLFDG
jgi:nicotinamidase-related amidase